MRATTLGQGGGYYRKGRHLRVWREGKKLAAAQTLNVQTGSLTYTERNEVVYILSSRKATYKHIAHVVSHFGPNGAAVTECQIVANGGTVAIGPNDMFDWCNRGCKPRKVVS